MGREFVTSDTHFGHRNVLNFCPTTRPYNTVEEMDDDIIRIWNTHVRPHDTVYHLGDVSFANPTQTREIVERLNGNIHLITGNHDSKTIKSCSDQFQSIQEYVTIKRNKQRIILFHFPIVFWHSMEHGSIHLFGHMHGDYRPTGRNIDVGWDVFQRPVELTTLIEMINERPIEQRREKKEGNNE